jgi:hypothetical protein
MSEAGTPLTSAAAPVSSRRRPSCPSRCAVDETPVSVACVGKGSITSTRQAHGLQSAPCASKRGHTMKQWIPGARWPTHKLERILSTIWAASIHLDPRVQAFNQRRRDGPPLRGTHNIEQQGLHCTKRSMRGRTRLPGRRHGHDRLTRDQAAAKSAARPNGARREFSAAPPANAAVMLMFRVEH